MVLSIFNILQGDGTDEFSPLRTKRSNEVKITERAVRLELSLQHRPDAILNLGGLFSEIEKI